MKKVISLAAISLLSLGTVSVLASCDQTDDSSTSSPDETSSSTVQEQEVGDGVNSIDIQVSVEEFEHMSAIVQRYNTLMKQNGHDNYTVKCRLVGISEADIGNKFNAAAADQPVILHAPGNNSQDWAATQKLHALVPDAVSLANGQTMNVAESGLVKDSNEVYGGAFTVNTFFLIYNKNVYTEKNDVKDILSMGKVLKEYNEANPDNQFQFAVNCDFFNGWQMQAFLFRNHDTQDSVLEIQGPKGKDETPNGFTQEGTKDQIARNFIDYQYLIQHSVDKGLAQPGPLAFNNTAASSMTPNTPNNCAAYISGTWNIADAEKAIGKENVGCAILPQFVDVVASEEAGTLNTDAATLIDTPMCQDYKSIVINEQKYSTLSADAKKAVEELVLFSLTKEAQEIRLSGSKLTPPVTKEDLDSEVYKNYVATDALKGASDEYSFIQPSTAGWNKWWEAATALCGDMMNPETATPLVPKFDTVTSHVAGTDYYSKVAEQVAKIGQQIDAGNGISAN